jgi:hypothetical protein
MNQRLRSALRADGPRLWSQPCFVGGGARAAMGLVAPCESLRGQPTRVVADMWGTLTNADGHASRRHMLMPGDTRQNSAMTWFEPVRSAMPHRARNSTHGEVRERWGGVASPCRRQPVVVFLPDTVARASRKHAAARALIAYRKIRGRCASAPHRSSSCASCAAALLLL